jgi:hypothetical protein
LARRIETPERQAALSGESAEGQRATEIARLAAAQRRRLRWRHLIPLGVAVAAMALCAVGLVRSASLAPELVAGYLVAAVAAAFCLGRFHAGAALRRLPLVILLGAVGVLVAVFASALSDLPGAEGGSPTRETGRWRRPANLACLLVTEDDAERILGTPVTPPAVVGAALVRSASVCRYRARDRSATLMVVVRDGPPWRSAAHGTWLTSGDWSVGLRVARRSGGPAPSEQLDDLARRVAARLP